MTSDPEPFVTFSGDELAPLHSLGPTIQCPSCGGTHLVHCSSESPANQGSRGTLQFYRCADKTFLAGINQRSILSNPNRHERDLHV